MIEKQKKISHDKSALNDYWLLTTYQILILVYSESMKMKIAINYW